MPAVRLPNRRRVPDLCDRRNAEATAEARDRAARSFAIYGQLPSYRAMLDREGYEGPADLAIIGGAGEVEERIRSLDGAGVTTFAASEFGSRGQREATGNSWSDDRLIGRRARSVSRRPPVRSGAPIPRTARPGRPGARSGRTTAPAPARALRCARHRPATGRWRPHRSSTTP